MAGPDPTVNAVYV